MVLRVNSTQLVDSCSGSLVWCSPRLVEVEVVLLAHMSNAWAGIAEASITFLSLCGLSMWFSSIATSRYPEFLHDSSGLQSPVSQKRLMKGLWSFQMEPWSHFCYSLCIKLDKKTHPSSRPREGGHKSTFWWQEHRAWKSSCFSARNLVCDNS